MKAIHLNDLAMLEVWHDEDANARWKAGFPFNPAIPGWKGVGTDSSQLVYFELEPGQLLGEHSDSAEEIVFVVDGEVEATVGGETSVASKGTLVVIPEMVPHQVRNVGDTTAKCIGFYPTARIGHTFTHTMQPLGLKVVGP